jgi:hypothetical protein
MKDGLRTDGSPADGLRAADAPTPGSARSAWVRRWRGARLWIALLAVAVLIGAYYAVTASGDDRTLLGPNNPAPDGARAVARVLERHGVAVVVPATLSEARAALREADGGSTLLFHDPGAILNREQLRALAASAADAGRSVLVTPGMQQLAAFSPAIRPAGVVPESAPSPVAADCPLPVAAQARHAAAGGSMYRAPGGCFPVPAAGGPAYEYARDGAVTVLGNPAFLDNGHILDQAHAALSLRTLGAEPTLIWYQPTFADHVATGPAASPFELLPAWVSPALAWLMVLGLLAIVWRARRDGPLVPEPLPVVVPAAETAEGRARLYQDARAVGAARAALRSASLGRLAAHLRLGHGTTADSIVATAAKESGRPPAQLRALYFPDRVASEAQLVAWANDLNVFEKEMGIP